jgi:hypothetical protein
LPEPKLIDFDGDFRINMYRNKIFIAQHATATCCRGCI